MPQKIYARQVPPEQADTRDYMDFIEEYGLIIYGNRFFKEMNTCLIDDAKSFYDDPDVTKVIYCEKGYVLSEHQLEGLADSVSNHCFNDFLTDYLSAFYQTEYERRKIVGCTQGEWNYAYVPKNQSPEFMSYVEAVYFNSGVEMECCISDEELDSPEGMTDTFYEYFDLCDEETLKKRIKMLFDCPSDTEVVLWMFDGWIRTPKYKRA